MLFDARFSDIFLSYVYVLVQSLIFGNTNYCLISLNMHCNPCFNSILFCWFFLVFFTSYLYLFIVHDTLYLLNFQQIKHQVNIVNHNIFGIIFVLETINNSLSHYDAWVFTDAIALDAILTRQHTNLNNSFSLNKLRKFCF